MPPRTKRSDSAPRNRGDPLAQSGRWRPRLDAVIEQLDDIVVIVDTGGRIVLANRAACEATGLSADAMIGVNMRERPWRVFAADGSEISPERGAVSRALRGESVSEEHRLVGADGRERWIWASAQPLLDAQGRVEGVINVGRDISERKRAEEALAASNLQLEEALAELRAAQQQVVQQERLRALGQMASGIAHDFNNALSPILAYTDLLLVQPERLADPEKARSLLEMINTAAEDAADVVRRLREFYREREIDETFEPVHLDELVAQAISLTQFRWKDQAQARGSSIAIATDLQPVPPVVGDPAALREALTNLIFNAVDAMPDGGTISIGAKLDGDTVVLAVGDTGTGMTEAVRRRCLEPFFTTKGEHGTGLGLGLVYGIIQRHRGVLEIESAPGQGTTVRLRLPIWTHALAKTAAPSVPDAARPLRILVVEDEPRVRSALTEFLSFDGHSVETAPDGRAGLQQFHAAEFDLVLTDSAMPGMSGDQLAAAIDRLAPNIPVIMVTGFGDLMNYQGERPPGVDLVVSKPLTLATLRQAIAQVTAR